MLGLLLAASLCMVSMAHGAEGFGQEVEAALKAEQYIYVATRRLNGEWSTAAPVWFMYDGEAVYFTTGRSSYKARRIHRGSPVRVWVGKEDGPVFEGEAHFIRDRTVVKHMAEVYTQKYWIAWLGLFRPRPGRVARGRTLVVKVTPVIDTR